MPVKFKGVVCSDCIQAIANDDYTGLDYYDEPKAAERREKEIRAGLAALGPNVVTSGEFEEFSSDECDCCGTHLAGERHGIAVLE